MSRGRSPEGVDCYGLLWLIYRDIGIQLPAYEGDYADHQDEVIPRLIEAGLQDCCWRELHGEPCQPGDLLVFRVCGHPHHIGVAVDNATMLHVDSMSTVVRERFRGVLWGTRLLSCHRHRDME